MDDTRASELASVRGTALRLGADDTCFDPLLDHVGDAELVLLGEASHGTRQFYEARAAITRRLIQEKGFTAVAVEGDWPDCYRVNRYVRGTDSDPDGHAALGDFTRFPTWMWRNHVVRDFVDWLRGHNENRAHGEQAGFYGLDMYSLYRSIEAVLDYLATVDPEAEAAARARYACLDHVGERRREAEHPLPLRADCEEEVIEQLRALQRAGDEYVRAGALDGDAHFAALQNARVVQSAEAYYRHMVRSDASTWNLRDQHMADTLQALQEHLSSPDDPARIVIWAHNSHVGDARATEWGRRGELTLGQRVRERNGQRARLIGFTTHHGSVTAASRWDGPARRQRVRPGLAESYEALFHEALDGAFFLPLSDVEPETLDAPRLERAIGVIYVPRTERQSHYFHCRLASQFDGVIHFDETDALHPLDPTSAWERGEAETFPFGM